MKRNIIKLIVPAFVLIAMLLTGCTRGFNINVGFPFNGIEKTGEEKASIDMRTANGLQVRNETGNINISKTSGSQIAIRMEKKVRGQVEDEVKSVLDGIKISAQYDADNCVIKAVTPDGTDFWKWKQQNHPMLNVNVDFYIELPQDFNGYDVKLVTGNIDISDMAGSFKVDNITGNLTLSNLKMSGRNQIKLITGNISVSSDIPEAESLDISNVTGNVNVYLPEGSDADISVRLTTGNISGSLLGQTSTALGGTDVNKTLGSGKTDVTVENITGNITVNKK